MAHYYTSQLDGCRRGYSEEKNNPAVICRAICFDNRQETCLQLGVQYMMYPQGQQPFDEDSFLRELYLSSKWILPFLLWIIMSYADIWKFFTSANEAEEVTAEEETETHSQ